jgi:hypothetical protein
MAANETQIRIAAVDATKQAFQSVQNNLGGLSSSLRTVAGLLASTFAGFSASRIISETAQYGKEISRLSQLSGMSAEQFQALAFGAERVGISTEKLSDIFKDTQDKVGDFVQTGGGALADFFDNIAPKVGVTIEQFRKLSGADALQLYVSSLEKANLSQSDLVFYLEAIASDSTLLLPLLKNNGQAFNALAEQARELGIVLEEDAIKQSAEFANNLQTLQALSSSLGKSFANNFIPALNEVASTFIAINKVSKEEGGLLTTLLKLTEFAELFGVGVTDKVVKAKNEIVKSSAEINKALEFKPPSISISATPVKKEAIEIITLMDAAKLKIREMDEAFALEEAPELISFFDKLKERIDQFDYENIKGGKTALEEYALAARNLGNQLDNVAVRSLRGLEDGLTGVLMGTMTVKDAFKSMASSIISDLIRIYIQRTIIGPLADALFGPMQSAGVSARAMGGPVSANRPYMVGERGPELFVPHSSGSIVANNKLAGGGGDTVVVNQTINLSAGVSQTVRAEVMNMMPKILDATKGAVADAKRRGGTFSKAFA